MKEDILDKTQTMYSQEKQYCLSSLFLANKRADQTFFGNIAHVYTG